MIVDCEDATLLYRALVIQPHSDASRLAEIRCHKKALVLKSRPENRGDDDGTLRFSRQVRSGVMLRWLTVCWRCGVFTRLLKFSVFAGLLACLVNVAQKVSRSGRMGEKKFPNLPYWW